MSEQILSCPDICLGTFWLIFHGLHNQCLKYHVEDFSVPYADKSTVIVKMIFST